MSGKTSKSRTCHKFSLISTNGQRTSNQIDNIVVNSTFKSSRFDMHDKKDADIEKQNHLMIAYLCLRPATVSTHRETERDHHLGITSWSGFVFGHSYFLLLPAFLLLPTTTLAEFLQL